MSPRLALVAVAMAAILVIALSLYWKGRHDGVLHERPRTLAAEARAVVSGLEVEGARQSAQRVDVVIRQREDAAATVTELTTKALTSEDAHAPLDPDRAARLRNADRQLCLAAPGLCATDRDSR